METLKETIKYSLVVLSSQLSALLWSSGADRCCHLLYQMASHPCSALAYHPYFHWTAKQLSVVVAIAPAAFVFVCLVFCCPFAAVVYLLYPAVGLLRLLVDLEPGHYNSKIQIIFLLLTVYIIGPTQYEVLREIKLSCVLRYLVEKWTAKRYAPKNYKLMPTLSEKGEDDNLLQYGWRKQKQMQLLFMPSPYIYLWITMPTCMTSLNFPHNISCDFFVPDQQLTQDYFTLQVHVSLV